ncbi:MAG: hypothetical protein EA383_10135 [Spirochaetaceae bacterium]|nr:MAG: hypothetical protein EA383_10135 [Spirochaetaceae bacterium]
MIGFTIKKAFFDTWDNLLGAALYNLGFVLVAAVPFLALDTLMGVAGGLLSILGWAAGVLLVFLYLGGLAFVARDMTDYTSVGPKAFWGYIKEAMPVSLVLGGIFLAQAFITSVAVPVYASMGNILGLAALVFLFWASVIWILSSQFVLPVRTRLNAKIGPVLKKSFMVFFDNTGFSLFMAAGIIALTVLSLPLAFLIPGPMGVLIWMQTGFKLRLMKYDYLEEHPDAKRSAIPWDELLYDERERVGSRTLRGMIFPWKE